METREKSTESRINANLTVSRKFCVAPMMDWTDRHYRYFARLISKEAVLYSEMVTTGALIHGDKDRHLQYSLEEHPVVLQLGGSNPAELAQCATLAEEYGYKEVNLNVGCPSDRVQNNMIGACLMGHADLVKTCLSAMSDACSLPITIKHRIGIDELDSYEFLSDFVGTVKESGCKTFIVHARKAHLQGLSPKQNREIPPLIYDYVYSLKKDHPTTEIIINGGIKTIEESLSHLQYVDGVMIGREAYQNPWLLADVDSMIYAKKANSLSRHDVIRQLYPYIEDQLSKGQKLSYITRHILGIFSGRPGGKRFRRYLSENAHKENANISTLEEALLCVAEA
ncbi:MAG: tRNA-dihydrouridine synthase A [Oleiphilaceae bacterium]